MAWNMADHTFERYVGLSYVEVRFLKQQQQNLWLLTTTVRAVYSHTIANQVTLEQEVVT